MELEPNKIAVIAVHLQQDIVGDDGGLTPMFREQVRERGVLAVARKILDGARRVGAKVIYTRVAFAPDFSNMHANSPLLSGTIAANCLIDGTPGAEIIADVAPSAADLIHTHQRIGPFAGSDLEQQLRGLGIERLIILGVATNASVETTARWASDLGFDVRVVEDACAAATSSAHRASIESMGMFGSIITSETLLAEWGAAR